MKQPNSTRQQRRRQIRRRRLFVFLCLIFSIILFIKVLTLGNAHPQSAAPQSPSTAECPESLAELLERNPETKEFVENYPTEYGKKHTVDMSEYRGKPGVPLFLQWDQRWGYLDYGDDVAGLTACGPMCLSMAGYALTGDETRFRPDRVIQFAIDEGYCIPGSGSSWSLISEGGPKLGLDVIEIPLVESRIVSNLEVGNPIICIMGPGTFTTSGHFILLTGMEDGKFRINDPNSRSKSERLWEYKEFCDQVRNLWVIRK